jgi:hypothetical protein
VTIVGNLSSLPPTEREIEVFIQVEGEQQTRDCVEVRPSATLQYLRSLICSELDHFNFDFRFLKRSG